MVQHFPGGWEAIVEGFWEIMGVSDMNGLKDIR